MNPVYWESGKLVFRISGLGMCPRALQAYGMRYMPLPHSQYTLKAFSAGHEHEDICKLRLRNLGFSIYDEQRELEYVSDSFILRGHVDGVCTHALHRFNRSNDVPVHYPDDILAGVLDWDGQPALLEVKSMNEDAFLEYKEKGIEYNSGYVKQLTCYMHLLGLPAIYVVQCRDDLSIDIRSIPSPPLRFGDIELEVHKIAESIRSNIDSDTEGLIDPAPGKYACPFSYLCPDCTPSEGRAVDLDAKIRRARNRLAKLEAQRGREN